MVVKVIQPSLHNVAHNIGISGVKYLLGPDATATRRLTWLIVIMGAFGWMTWNIYGRVAFYLAYPSTLDTHIAYHDKIHLPTVIICNQNSIRSSKVYKETDSYRKSPTFYEAITSYHKAMTGRSKKYTDGVIKKYSNLLQNTGNKDFSKRMAHDKHTLIKSCTWRGQACGPDAFTMVKTDLGICYKFTNTDEEEGLDVDLAGHDGGLSLTLMVEQYDYMRRWREAAGAVVLVTPRYETEAFADIMGIGVSVGTKTTIGIKKTKVIDMPSPHGTCGSRALVNFSNKTRYSPLRCQLDCLTSHVIRKCGCVHLYMPDKANVPICSLLDNLECADGAKREFYSIGLTSQCSCPTSCESETYSKSVSQTTLSRQHVNALSLAASETQLPGEVRGQSLTHVNQAIKIQAWGLLNDVNPAYTNVLAKMAASMDKARRIIKSMDHTLHSIADEIEKMIGYAGDDLPPFSTGSVSLYGNTQSSYGNMLDPHPPLPDKYTTGNVPTASMGKHKSTNESIRFHTDGLRKFSDMFNDFLNRSSNLDRYGFKFGLEPTLAYEFLQDSQRRFTSHNVFVTMLERRKEAASTSLNSLVAWCEAVLDQNVSTETTGRIKDTLGLIKEYIGAVKSQMGRCSEATDNSTAYMRELNAMEPVDDYVLLRPRVLSSMSPSFYRDNILNVDIYFEDLNVEEVIKSAAYSIEGLVCDIGGSVGLCLGGSILTFIELFDLILFSRKKRKEETYEPGEKLQDMKGEKKENPC